MRARRLKLPWLLAVPFLLLADPDPSTLLTGSVLAGSGLLLRAAAAGFIEKDRVLCVRGPYAHLRHPLYVGSFLLGAGLVVAAGRWSLIVAFPLLFPLLYRPAVRDEEAFLEDRFGDPYVRYRSSVPAVLPRSRPYEAEGLEPLGAKGFRLGLYRRNKEWQALLGAVLGFGLLWARALWVG